ncbi:IS30 family transposase [Kribbella rubisoli]|uniref:IS30 family transposase n=1 Tax=Kribbella rubisoli TaxID=3075929 RepID=A0A4Q7XF05_9ACTN|nr:IS30 family transposase [Kribbella rubisoli]
MSRARAYRLLRESGRRVGRARTSISGEMRERVVGEFGVSGSVNRAAKAAGLSHGAARRILVAAGLVQADRGPAGRPGAKDRFLQLVEEGWSIARASVEVGVNPRTGRDWRRGIRRVGNTRVHPDGTVVDYTAGTRYSTGVATTSGDVGISDDAGTGGTGGAGERYLSLDDRLVIADGLINRQTLTAIAAGIGRNKSTVCREVRAHSVDGIYLPHQADRTAAAARARPKPPKLVTNPALREQVEQGLEQKLSPEQISNRLVKDFPDDESMRVSHETIYQALYFQARGGLKREVVTALRTGRTRRKPQRRPDQRQQRFVDDMIMISERPAEADDRAVPGHWEGDLIMGAGNQSAIGTLVERATRYTMLVHLPGGHDAEQVRDELIQTMQTLPEHLRGSLTWDQGCEMARHKQFTIATDIAVYFCDPHSPWQRGTNENTNGLLRQYFPKGTDLSVHGPEDLEHVAQELNARPRKTLDWDTPAERLRDLLTT